MEASHKRYGLKRIIFIESARFKYIDIDIDSNTLLLGNSGVGKTSVMRAVLFFYTMSGNKDILGIGDSETKDSFNDYYFDINGASHIAYEYQTENGRFLFVVSRHKMLQYTFIDITNLEDFDLERLFFDEADIPLAHDKMILKLISKGLEYYTTHKREEYKNVLCKDEYKRMHPDFRRKNLSGIKFYLFGNKKDVEIYGRYLSKIFLNSKVSETSIKDMLTSLLDIDEESDSMSIATLDIDDLQMRLEKVAQKENDYRKFIEKIESEKIDELESYIKSYRELKQKSTSSKKELIFVIENHLQISSYVKQKLDEALISYDSAKKELATANGVLTKEVGVANDKCVLLKKDTNDTSKKKKDYESNNIAKILGRYHREQELKNKRFLLEKEKGILSGDVKNLEIKKKQDKLDAVDIINSTYKQEEKSLAELGSSLMGEYKSINTKKNDREKKELSPKQLEHDELKSKIAHYANKIKIAESEIKGLKKSKIENTSIVEINEEMERVEPIYVKNDALLRNSNDMIVKEENKQIANSEEFTEAKDNINQKYADKKRVLDGKISTLTEAKDKILSIDKESLFGEINRDDSAFKDYISFVVKDEILYDENIAIQKVDDSNTLYGYKLDIVPETIESKISGLKQKIKELNQEKALIAVDEKQAQSTLADKAKKESKKIKTTIVDLTRDRNKFKNIERTLSENIGALEKSLKIEMDKEALKIKDSILKLVEQNFLDDEESNLLQEIFLKLSSEVEQLRKEIDLEFKEESEKIQEKDDEVKQKQKKLDIKKSNKIKESDEQIEGIYIRALESNGSDAKRIVYLDNRIAIVSKILSYIDEHRHYTVTYINTDRKKIENLKNELEKLEKLEKHKLDLESKKTKVLERFSEKVNGAYSIHSEYKDKHEKISNFFANREDYISDFKLENTEESFEKTIKTVLDEIEVDVANITKLPKTINEIQESIGNKYLRIKDTMIYITKGFTKENTLGLPIIDGETESAFEYMSIGSVYIDYKNNELHKKGKDLALDDLADTVRLISSNVNNVRDKIQQMESLLDEVNKTIGKSIEDIAVLDRLQINYTEDVHNPIISSLDNLVEYSDNNSHIYLGSLVREDDKKTFDKIYVDIEKIVKLLDNSKKRKVYIEDLITITFRVAENGKDWGELTSLDDIGSNGTGIMAKAIIYISLLHKNAIKCKVHDNQYFHCVMDEIGQISENYFSELMLSAQKRGFIFLNGIPVEAENMIQLYPNVYTGYSENNASDFVNTTKEYLEYE